jgi:hypothetical protein
MNPMCLSTRYVTPLSDLPGRDADSTQGRISVLEGACKHPFHFNVQEGRSRPRSEGRLLVSCCPLPSIPF